MIRNCAYEPVTLGGCFGKVHNTNSIMAYRKTMKFTDVTSKYSGPDRMDFTEWLEKAEHAFQVMGLQDAKEKVEIFPVYMEEPCNDIAATMSLNQKPECWMTRLRCY